MKNGNNILVNVHRVGIRFKRNLSERKRGINNSFSNVFRMLLSRPQKEGFWALKDISFCLRKGDVIGLIGRNGAGKSTLLKILSNVLIPDEGAVKIAGRVSSLLALGSGFMLNLNGRENIYLNAMYMGMNKREIDEAYNDIVSFSELDKFIETPIKYYSMGMKARLGFSIAVHTKPDILIIDEVLGAGDKKFQQKAQDKMAEFFSAAKGIVIASHNINQISEIASKCLWIDKGKVKNYGETDVILTKFKADKSSNR